MGNTPKIRKKNIDFLYLHSMNSKITIFWFRRDLRLHDNIGFCKALQGKFPVLPIFIFDTKILGRLPKQDPRVSFIHHTLENIDRQLKTYSSGISMYHGSPMTVFQKLMLDYDVQNVITNRDYEPYGIERDALISDTLSKKGIGFYSFKDHVVFETNEITKSDGSPYIVYTPYMKKWKEKFRRSYQLKNYDPTPYFDTLFKARHFKSTALSDLGFEPAAIHVLPFRVSPKIIDAYGNTRDFPSKEGTTLLGPHLRFGTVSVREVIQKAILQKNEVFWQELIWREFFMQILWHFPHTKDKSFKGKYDRIEWNNNEKDFEKWRNGTTGYLLVDAGMRELNATGYMHNRVRMLVASFLCKHLLIDWRWGETYFAEKLLDYEMSSNVGNWQWAAGSGVDAAPYFRIFNPMTQVEKFDKDHIYIKKWVPEAGTDSYPLPMVGHKWARERCLSRYKKALN